MKSGYYMLDCSGINLSADSEVTVTGLYNKIVEAMKSNKPIIAYNIQAGQLLDETDVFVSPTNIACFLRDDGYVFTISIGSVVVAEDDGVTVTLNTPSEDESEETPGAQ